MKTMLGNTNNTKYHKKKININDSIGSEENAKTGPWKSTYRDSLTYAEKIVDENFINNLCIEYSKWGYEDPNAFCAYQFPRMKGIPRGTWKHWLVKFKQLREANEEVKEDIAQRRELGVGGVHERKLDHSMLRPISRYSVEWAEVEEREAALKRRATPDAQGAGIINVIMEPAPHTQEVADKIAADERRNAKKT